MWRIFYRRVRWSDNAQDDCGSSRMNANKNDWPAIVLDQRRYALLKGTALAVPQVQQNQWGFSL
jgi:hypothetical protein